MGTFGNIHSEKCQSWNGVVLVFVCMMTLTAGENLGDISDKLDTVDRKLDIIADGLGIPLEEELQRTTTREPPTVETVGNEFITLLDIERTSSEDELTFTLRYRNYSDVTVLRLDPHPGLSQIPDSVTEDGYGLCEATFSLNATSTRQAWLAIGSSEFGYTLRLNVTGTENMYQELRNPMKIEVSPGADVTYNPGEDTNVTVLWPNGPFDNRKFFSGINMSDLTYQLHLSMRTIAEERYVADTGDYSEVELTFLTSSHPVSGYLSLSQEVYSTGGSVVPTMKVEQNVRVYPSNQSGVFPPGFLGFVKLPSQTPFQDDDSVETHICTPGTECDLSCYGVGEEISYIDVGKQSSRGSPMRRVSSSRSPPIEQDNFRTITWSHYEPANPPAGANNVPEYTCRIYDNYGNRRTKVVKVQQLQLLSFDEWSDITG